VSDSNRRKRIIRLTELSGPGLEIGPLHRPIMRKPRWDVSYVDVVGTEQLLARYDADLGVRNDRIVDVDFALTGPDGVIRPLSHVVKDKSPFSWVVASHVIEHVPDLITWLDEIATLLTDGGALVLAIPDTRYTFDAYRPLTTVGQMLQAHHQQDHSPSVRAVYDYLRSACSITPADAWADRHPGLENSRYHDISFVAAQVELAKGGHYIDSHVWTFRPSTFIEQINELGRLGLCEFVVEKVRNTRPDQLEFYAVLRRLPRDRSLEQDTKLRAAGKQKTNDDPSRFRPDPVLPTVPTGMVLSDREKKLILRKRALVGTARRALRRG
jgi:hypothetical protein